MALYIHLLAFIFLYTTAAFQFQDCGSEVGSFTTIEISECPTAEGMYCILKKGSVALLKIHFIPSVDVQNVTAVVHGIIGVIPVPFHLPNSNGCFNSGLKCPLKKDVQYIYTTSLPILDTYPKVKITVKWELKSENNKDIVCFQVPAKLI